MECPGLYKDCSTVLFVTKDIVYKKMSIDA
jgi:hypothetical protein